MFFLKLLDQEKQNPLGMLNVFLILRQFICTLGDFSLSNRCFIKKSTMLFKKETIH